MAYGVLVRHIHTGRARFVCMNAYDIHMIYDTYVDMICMCWMAHLGRYHHTYVHMPFLPTIGMYVCMYVCIGCMYR